jgi:hypothetical protein
MWSLWPRPHPYTAGTLASALLTLQCLPCSTGLPPRPLLGPVRMPRPPLGPVRMPRPPLGPVRMPRPPLGPVRMPRPPLGPVRMPRPPLGPVRMPRRLLGSLLAQCLRASPLPRSTAASQRYARAPRLQAHLHAPSGAAACEALCTAANGHDPFMLSLSPHSGADGVRQPQHALGSVQLRRRQPPYERADAAMALAELHVGCTRHRVVEAPAASACVGRLPSLL